MLFVIVYIISICIANLSVAFLGPVMVPVNSFCFIALDMTIRDKLHDRWSGNGLALRMLGLIIIAGVLSYAINPASGVIALASIVSFIVSNLIDAVVYQVMVKFEWKIRANSSNFAGAVADSLLFPFIAFGSLPVPTILAQILAKTLGGLIWSELLGRCKSLNFMTKIKF